MEGARPVPGERFASLVPADDGTDRHPGLQDRDLRAIVEAAKGISASALLERGIGVEPEALLKRVRRPPRPFVRSPSYVGVAAGRILGWAEAFTAGRVPGPTPPRESHDPSPPGVDIPDRARVRHRNLRVARRLLEAARPYWL